ncbi:hypothetical protein MKX03_008883 [Papaver bracteatum]|nr:hypothetical protein MKX03_008883 [Papaver bracteatum]
MSVVTPLGHEPDEFYNNLLEGVSGISDTEGFDCSKLLEKSSLSRRKDGLHQNSLKWLTSSCSTCLLLGRKALADGVILDETQLHPSL